VIAILLIVVYLGPLKMQDWKVETEYPNSRAGKYRTGK